MSSLECMSETVSEKSQFQLTRFDVTVAATVAALIAAIAMTVLLGDRVGVRLERAGPLEIGHSTSPIFVQFSEDMERDSATARLKVEPEVDGEFRWTGTTMTFRPSTALKPGETYNVTLEPGAESVNGRKVLDEYRFSFTVQRPRVAFLAPADAVPQNIWIADPANPSAAEQVTFSTSGIANFGVSPDGTRIAYSERNTNNGTSDIFLLDLDTGDLRQLTDCSDADCTTPVWSPDGTAIAYERVDFNSALDSVGVSPTRVWLINLTASPITTRPLFADTQILSYAPQFSADGSRVAVYDRNQGILIYDYERGDDGGVFLIRSNYGTIGALSPDGEELVYPYIELQEGQARSSLRRVELETQETAELSEPDDPFEDFGAVWHPDGERIVIARRYLDDRWTRGRQLYLMDMETGKVETLVRDEQYAHGFFEFDPTGNGLVIQRFPELDAAGNPNTDGRPEIWTYDIENDQLTQVAENAYFPRWVP